MGMLDGKTAVVTGAGRGLGHAISLLFASEGADVACVSRNPENARRTAEEVRALGRSAWALAIDLSSPSAAQSGAEALLGDTPSTDILVNNAGITRDGLLARMSDEDWDQVLNTNLRGAFLMTRALTRRMMKQRAGRIVNIGSVVGLSGNPGQANYSASKSGLIGLTKSVARELAPRGITANLIAPGFIETDMTASLGDKRRKEILGGVPLGRMGRPEDIAQAALFLAGPASGYITGQVLCVDGGMAM